MLRTALAAAFAALLATASAAAEPQVRSLEGAASPPATIDQAAWLAGRWVGEGPGATVEEAFAPPLAGQMIGHFRLARDGEPQFYQVLLVRERDGSLVYGLKHFDPDGRAWEARERWVEFPLVAVEGDTLYFSGLTLVRDGPDGLTAHVRFQSPDGARRIETFRFRRAR